MKKVLFSVFALLLVLCPISLISAQETDGVFCGDLSIDDCALYRDSAAKMAAVESGSIQFLVQYTTVNARGKEKKSDIEFVAAGTFSLTPLVLSNPVAHLSTLQQALEQTINTAAFDAMLIMKLDDPLLPEQSPADLRLVDGILYINMDDVAKMMNQPVPGQWFGLDVAELYQSLISQMMLPNGKVTTEIDNPFTDSDLLSAFVEIKRVEPDVELDGQMLAFFQTSINVKKLLQHPIFREKYLKPYFEPYLEQAGLNAEHGETLLDTYVNLFEVFLIINNQYVSLEDHYLRNSHFAVSIAFERDIFDQLMRDSQITLPWYEILLRASIQLDDFNTGQVIVAPSNHVLIPMDGPNMMWPSQ